MRIVQISDTHISHLGGVPRRNMELVAEYLNHQLRPDLVVNTGDIVILDADSAEDRHTAWRLHQEIGGPLRVVPGNHDVGEPGDGPWMGMSVTSERVANFKHTWGSDRFVEFGEPANGAEGWVFIGINSQVLSSHLPEEADQWHWLEEVVGKVQGLSVLLFLHKPMSLSGRADRDITIAASDRERLRSIFRGTRLRVVANGHVHRYRQLKEDGLLSVWCPSLTFAPSAEPERGLPSSEAGVVEYLVQGDDVEVIRHEVPGLRGCEDVFTMPEFAATLAGLKATTADPA